MYTQQRSEPAAARRPRHRRRRAILSLTLAGLTGLTAAGAVVLSTCTLCYAVSSGNGLVYVREAETCEAAVENVENRVSRILQTNYTYDQPTRVVPAIAPKEEVQTSVELTASLMDTVEQVKYQYSLYLDGTAVGACDSREAVDAALWQARTHFLNEHTISVSLDNAVEVLAGYVPVETETLSAAQLADRLLSGGEGVPPLAVRTVEEVTETRAIPAPVEGREDPSLLQGQSVTLQAGQEGTEEHTDRVTRLRGEEVQRETIASSVLTEPVPSVVAVGTMEGIEGAKGRFQWPCTGEITSPFGMRHIFGSYSFHTGLDIALKKGSPIAAAADGTVIWSGREGTYGNLIIVDHHNGFCTYYAHCSTLLAEEGDEVSQGETIAKVGSTGRSTGPHCHFEIRWQDEPLDPQRCLP